MDFFIVKPLLLGFDDVLAIEVLINDRQTAADLELAAAKAFQPRAPIGTRELFAGRWGQLTTVVDAVGQTGLHIVIFGERGVGKTSLANIIEPLVKVMEESQTGGKAASRLVVKVNAHHGDTFSDIWNRAFNEVSWSENQPAIGLFAPVETKKIPLKTAFGLNAFPTIDDVRRMLTILKRSVFIFDELIEPRLMFGHPSRI